MTLKLASVSIDLDEVPRYVAIHGLRYQLGDAAHGVYDRCIPRLTTWLQAETIPATFFVIGEDLERPRNRDLVSTLHAAGHEIANHTHHHFYDLVRRSEVQVRDEVERAASMIEQACGERPVGFRAPGYTVTDRLLGIVQEAGAEYDSSVFPCASYYAAKAAALTAIKLSGRKSASILDTLAVLRAPRGPYRVGQPYWRRGGGIFELPIGVTRFQLPYIGTSLVIGGRRLAVVLTKQMLGREHINLELHGFDAADRNDDGMEALVPHRADLRRSANGKLEALSAAVGIMRKAGYQFVTLRDAARRLSSRPSQ